MQNQKGDPCEPGGSHEGQRPQEAMRVLRLSSPAPTWISLLQSKSVVDVLCGGTGRREDRPSGIGGGKSLVGDWNRKEQTK